MVVATQLAAHLAQQHVDLTFWINNAKANAAGKVPVSLRITIHGTRAEASPGIRCLPQEWDKATKRLIPKSRKDEVTRALNEVLDKFEASARLLNSTLQPLPGAASVTASQVRAALLPPKPAPVPDALKLLDAALASRKNPYSHATDQTALRAFKAWLNRPALPLPLLDADLVGDFAHAVPQAVRYVPRLQALFAVARPKDANPFAVATPAAGKKLSRARYVLSKEELARLAALDLVPGRARWARDIYLCQYYLHGSRLGPVLELDWGQIANGRARFRAEKGGGEHDVKLHPKLLKVLAHYGPKPGLVFPLLPANYAALSVQAKFKARKAATTLVWHGLQDCAQLLDLPGRLHSHTARHSLATHTVEATGSIRAAQGMLGHKKESTTERYVRPMLTQQLDNVADSVYD
jgi:integrase